MRRLIHRRPLLVATVLLGVLWLGRDPLRRTLGGFLVEEDPLEHADAIVVPSGSFPDRILEAVALYRQGLAPRILLCEERENAAFRRLAALGVSVPRGIDLNRSVAEQLGVPAEAIFVVDEPPGSTFTEAVLVIRQARNAGYRSLLLVTSRYHTRRAGYIYRHLAGDSPRIIVRPARDDGFRPEGWWRSRSMTRRVVIEYQKLLVFLLYDRWRAPSEGSATGR